MKQPICLPIIENVEIKMEAFNNKLQYYIPSSDYRHIGFSFSVIVFEFDCIFKFSVYVPGFSYHF